MDIKTIISKANNKLVKSNIKTSYLDSEILLSKIIKKNREFIILNPKIMQFWRQRVINRISDN